MIDVYLHKNGDHYTEFRVKGHAGYAERGKDIVCAAVSTLTITLENALNEMSDVPIIEKRYVSDEHPVLDIPYPSDKTDILINQYRIGIEGVQEAFPDYVRLHLET